MTEQNTTIERVNVLLEEVNRIADKNDELTKESQENWNIFLILRQAHDEENLHSAFISELLDPNGPHDLGTVFADSFFKLFAPEFTVSQTTQVVKEKYLGQGVGRADIYLQTADQIAIIENKIWAHDQPRQMRRYHECLQRDSKSSGTLIYLTLNGKEAPIGKPHFDYVRISYEKDILEWLDQCMKDAEGHLSLHSTIKQYIYLVRKLTHQLTNKEMNTKLEEAIGKDLEAAELIGQHLRSVKLKLVAGFLQSVYSELTTRLKGEWEVIYEGDTFEELVVRTWGKLVVRNKYWPENVSVAVEGQRSMVDGRTIYGVYGDADQVDQQILGRIIKADLVAFRLKQRNPYWLSYAPLLNLSDTSNLAKIAQSPEVQGAMVKTVVSDIFVLCEVCEKAITGREA